MAGREAGGGEEEYSQYRENLYSDYSKVSTLKKVAPPTLPKPGKPDILSYNYPARNITTV